MTDQKKARFELRLSLERRKQLKELARRRGVSMTDVVDSMIRRAAARAKI